MDSTTVILIIAATTLQTVTVWAWLTARARAKRYRAGHDYMLDAYTRLRANSHRRDPKTGRLLPRGE